MDKIASNTESKKFKSPDCAQLGTKNGSKKSDPNRIQIVGSGYGQYRVQLSPILMK